MFVKIENAEEVSTLFDKLVEEYVECYGDAGSDRVALLDYDQATQTFPVTVQVEVDYDFAFTYVCFPKKVYTVEELCSTL